MQDQLAQPRVRRRIDVAASFLTKATVDEADRAELAALVTEAVLRAGWGAFQISVDVEVQP